jgi:hypothetical protein
VSFLLFSGKEHSGKGANHTAKLCFLGRIALWFP